VFHLQWNWHMNAIFEMMNETVNLQMPALLDRCSEIAGLRSRKSFSATLGTLVFTVGRCRHQSGFMPFWVSLEAKSAQTESASNSPRSFPHSGFLRTSGGLTAGESLSCAAMQSGKPDVREF